MTTLTCLVYIDSGLYLSVMEWILGTVYNSAYITSAAKEVFGPANPTKGEEGVVRRSVQESYRGKERVRKMWLFMENSRRPVNLC